MPKDMLQFVLYSHIAIQCALWHTKLSYASPSRPLVTNYYLGGFAWQFKDLYRLLAEKDVPDDNSSPYSHEHTHYKTRRAHTNLSHPYGSGHIRFPIITHQCR
jgi:hypothetical protein